MKTRVLTIGVAALVLVLAAGAGGLYAYDSSRSDVIAKGITAGGVDIGGLSAARARDVLRRSLGPKLNSQVVLLWHNRRWTLTPATIDARLGTDRMVREALAHSRTGNFFNRAMRDLRGDKVQASVPLRVAHSRAKLYAFIGRVAKQIDQRPVDATIQPTASSLDWTPSRDGVAVQRRFLAARILRMLRDPNARRVGLIPTRTLRPHLSTSRLAYKYQTFITIDRSHFTLRLWKNLRLYRSYTIAVGRQGLETPAGLYEINDRQVNPSWHVPNSSWAGALAGRVIPPGPDDPIKARWLGFYNGAGIHGTDEISSLGTAASHGCIRMSIPDVEQLYPLVPLHTPIYVG
jgi:L,D-transpeptidase catalytic domain/Putative peptidoglycan binding domain